MEIVWLVLSQCFNAIYVDETSISIEAVESDMCCGPFDVVGAKHEDSRRSEGRAQKKKKKLYVDPQLLVHTCVYICNQFERWRQLEGFSDEAWYFEEIFGPLGDLCVVNWGA